MSSGRVITIGAAGEEGEEDSGAGLLSEGASVAFTRRKASSSEGDAAAGGWEKSVKDALVLAESNPDFHCLLLSSNPTVGHVRKEEEYDQARDRERRSVRSRLSGAKYIIEAEEDVSSGAYSSTTSLKNKLLSPLMISL